MQPHHHYTGKQKMKFEVQGETLKAVPAVAGTVYSSFTLNECVAVATLLYIALQAVYLIWKWRKEAKG